MAEQRNCVGCGQVDDHPRDVVALADGSTAYYHHDCHARLDPPCESCAWLVQHKGDLVGHEWRTQIGNVHNALTPEQLAAAHPSEKPVVEQFLNGQGV
ncbi:hypothetical protein AB0383_20685 [Amycolatopsis sp. NPDC051373]|uniref:hypothetical protein n=1 Tax=Amycolatopsis sp. NPDC051373 TaxID=3155801 RepID=UPI00344EC6C8